MNEKTIKNCKTPEFVYEKKNRTNTTNKNGLDTNTFNGPNKDHLNTIKNP